MGFMVGTAVLVGIVVATVLHSEYFGAVFAGIFLVCVLWALIVKIHAHFTRKKIKASLVLKTDSESYRPGDNIGLSVEMAAEEDFLLREAKVRFDPVTDEKWDPTMEAPFWTQHQVSNGQSLFALFKLQLPLGAFGTWDIRLLLDTSPEICWGLEGYRSISLKL